MCTAEQSGGVVMVSGKSTGLETGPSGAAQSQVL